MTESGPWLRLENGFEVVPIPGKIDLLEPFRKKGLAAKRLPYVIDFEIPRFAAFQATTDSLDHLRAFTPEEINELVLPKRTLARRKAKKELLTVEETDKALRLDRTAKLAEQVFGDVEKAARWLRKPKQSLNGETPLAFLASESGARAVEEMLLQIDSGMLP